MSGSPPEGNKVYDLRFTLARDIAADYRRRKTQRENPTTDTTPSHCGYPTDPDQAHPFPLCQQPVYADLAVWVRLQPDTATPENRGLGSRAEARIELCREHWDKVVRP